MANIRLVHPSRPALPFHQPQDDTDEQQIAGSVVAELGTDRPPLVHVETRTRSRQVRGRVTGARRARNDASTSDPRQAVANYVDRLEAHVDEFQGDGYTFEDDIRDDSYPAILTSVEWTLTDGQPESVEFTADAEVGIGVFESEPIQPENPTVDPIPVPARVDGIDLTGLREMSVTTSIGVETNAIYNPQTAANNQIVPDEGRQREIRFRGTHTGTRSERATKDDALAALQDGRIVDFETAFPGYTLRGKVLGYESDLQTTLGDTQTNFTLRFLEAVDA